MRRPVRVVGVGIRLGMADVGVGAVRRLSAVRWGVAAQIVWAWALTIPAAFLIAAATYTLLRLGGIH